MKEEPTDKDFIQGNKFNSESMKCNVISSDTKQLLPYDENNHRVPDDYKVLIRKDGVGRVYKKCNCCREWKLLKEFSKSKVSSATGGVKGCCKHCEEKGVSPKYRKSKAEDQDKEPIEEDTKVEVSELTEKPSGDWTRGEVYHLLGTYTDCLIDEVLKGEKLEYPDPICEDFIRKFKSEFEAYRATYNKAVNKSALQTAIDALGSWLWESTPNNEDEMYILSSLDTALKQFKSKLEDKVLDELTDKDSKNEDKLLKACANSIVNKLIGVTNGDSYLTEDQLDIINPIIDNAIKIWTTRMKVQLENTDKLSDEDLIAILRKRGYKGTIRHEIEL